MRRVIPIIAMITMGIVISSPVVYAQKATSGKDQTAVKQKKSPPADDKSVTTEKKASTKKAATKKTATKKATGKKAPAKKTAAKKTPPDAEKETPPKLEQGEETESPIVNVREIDEASQEVDGDIETPEYAYAEEVERAAIEMENSPEACQDGYDNDGDEYVDCDDQDCEIFAVCVQIPDQTVIIPPTVTPETGWQCKDGHDNDENGLIDCHDSPCKFSKYCRRLMYERPEPKNKAPGFFINFGLGVALPNYRKPTAEVNIGPDSDVPFDPDIGVMLDLQAGYLPFKFIGAGINFKAAFTHATNEEPYFEDTDDPNEYKYTGSKYYGNLGGFIRLQWPFKRIVPYLNMHLGYSVSRHEWTVYDPDNDWKTIREYERDDSTWLYENPPPQEETLPRARHFTFALEPGIELLIVPRFVGMGLRAWLPVVANKDASRDNLGVLINFSFYPVWREAPVLKPEYQPKKQ